MKIRYILDISTCSLPFWS